MEEAGQFNAAVRRLVSARFFSTSTQHSHARVLSVCA
jgi:hypothetical protein